MPASIVRLHTHIHATLQMLRYFFVMQETFPHVMVQLTAEQTREIAPQTLRWIEFCREIYARPELGCDPPSPIPIDADCPPHLLSDQVRRALGRNHPFFDFVHSPFTHPIGTQISVTCISAAWNAYDTFINETIGTIKATAPNDERVLALLSAEAALREENLHGRLPSDCRLELLGIAMVCDDFETAARNTGKSYFRNDTANRLLTAGKDIRSTFTHHFGAPTERMQRMMSENSFEDLGFRMTSEGLEITLLAARNIIEVILLKADTIAGKANAIFEV